MRSSNLAWPLIAALVVLIGGLVYGGIEWVEKEVDRGYSEEASRNDFLAAELFLQKYGIQAETVSGMSLLDALPPTTDLILLSASRESMSERRRTDLAAWVRDGGRLFVVAHALYDPDSESSEDRLLDELGVFLLAPDEEQPGDEEGESRSLAAEPRGDPGSQEVEGESPEQEDDEQPDDRALPETFGDLMSAFLAPTRCEQAEEGLTEVSTAEVGTIRLELASENGLAVQAERLDDAYLSTGAQVLFFDVAAGQVVGVTSIAPFRNRRIHCHDHAYFLHYVADGARKVWLLHDPDVASLAELAMAQMPLTTSGGLILVGLVLAAASLRFGVAPLEDEVGRRELREHLEASASFHFRKGGFAALFYRLRRDLERSAAGGSFQDRQRWAARAGLSSEEAQEAFADSVPRSRGEILKRMRVMLRMRRMR
ncbi:MAG: hypothetical protein CL908_17275 [Deltaproteobacteria bacterium]|nr:hypothetical protein [Deltaproteobacteria bacterium]